MLVRMAGHDADMGFSPSLLDVVKRAEERFPAPEFAILVVDAQDEDEDDTLMIARRYSGVLVPMVYLTLLEIDEMEEAGTDWLTQAQTDLERSEADIEQAERVVEGLN